MNYYEVLVADVRYKSSAPLIYASEEVLPLMSVVTVPLRARMATGFVMAKVSQPSFVAKPIKSVISSQPLPSQCLELARWMADYYATGLGEALRQFAPSKPSVRQIKVETLEHVSEAQLELKSPLTTEQTRAIKEIKASPSTTVLLHGETGSGKTRVYLELAKETMAAGKSVVLLTPEISLTTQLAAAAESYLQTKPLVLHSQLSAAKRKQLWLKVIESNEPQVVIGPRSALFTPLASVGLIVLDEAHEPAYKQEQSPRYSALRVASQLGSLT